MSRAKVTTKRKPLQSAEHVDLYAGNATSKWGSQLKYYYDKNIARSSILCWSERKVLIVFMFVSWWPELAVHRIQNVQKAQRQPDRRIFRESSGYLHEFSYDQLSLSFGLPVKSAS